MNTPPAISIIIVTYNAAGTLQVCLDSIYKQQYPSLKIIIIDGNSTDGTVDIIKANINKIHYWQSEPDAGVYDAMNKAVKHLTGDWVYFIGADDELLPEFSDMALELKDPTAIYYANVFAEGSKRRAN
ncbi:glycosyltransferase [Mucilaginibacter humi]|uniref:glycosyltransferase n=1 Tax=Mucilaginibacter humi TaxID=2732510 RepID=UPI00293B991C|nr:glycosyltransferase [Mucilaginibacter humi]